MVDRKLNREAIAAHNYYRRAHGCPKLTYDDSLARSAQKWAEELARFGHMQHGQNVKYGENLSSKWTSNQASISGCEATQMWYDEVSFHDYTGDFSPKSGHFTQLIWKSTTKAGFGRATSSDGKSVYVVGHYWEAGNVIGKFRENVPRPIRSVEKYDPTRKPSKSKCAIM
ncbi:hypothetical protein EG68_11337 [Paragonimus skrjabini miyazakii]|uniref:SCP domain-containing protein n=1 Tax=Paragonimus skrjabini miyazakii TaxID=59628 RepID=A0A8S9YBY4_9TREM|nr:hypothetical protein EG68_11337 [Paragonimus skrjabini miyazakii]